MQILQNVDNFLSTHAEMKYADFNRKFISSKYRILGVRIPALKKFAKEIEPEYIDLEKENLSFEEILLYGYSAAQISKSEDEQCEYLQQILPYFDNWATCDCVTAEMKKMTSEKSFEFFCNLTQSTRAYYVRCGIVGLMKFFLKSEKMDEAIAAVAKIVPKERVVKMAIGWFLCEVATVDFQKGKREIEKCKNREVKSIAITKIQQSLRISKQNKEEIKKLRN